jgi:hypothetical protein
VRRYVYHESSPTADVSAPVSGDASYWNFQSPDVPDDHLYVVAAANAGYTTFRYDRLGTGHSEHPSDAYK